MSRAVALSHSWLKSSAAIMGSTAEIRLIDLAVSLVAIYSMPKERPSYNVPRLDRVNLLYGGWTVLLMGYQS